MGWESDAYMDIGMGQGKEWQNKRKWKRKDGKASRRQRRERGSLLGIQGFTRLNLALGVGLARAQYSLGSISIVAAFSVAFQLKGLAQDVLTGCIYSDVTSSQ